MLKNSFKIIVLLVLSTTQGCSDENQKKLGTIAASELSSAKDTIQQIGDSEPEKAAYGYTFLLIRETAENRRRVFDNRPEAIRKAEDAFYTFNYLAWSNKALWLLLNSKDELLANYAACAALNYRNFEAGYEIIKTIETKSSTAAKFIRIRTELIEEIVGRMPDGPVHCQFSETSMKTYINSQYFRFSNKAAIMRFSAKARE